MKIEEFVRKQLKDAETTPPEELWGQLEQRMKHKPTGRKWIVATAAFLSAACIAVAVIMALNTTSQPETSQNKGIAYVSPEETPQPTTKRSAGFQPAFIAEESLQKAQTPVVEAIPVASTIRQSDTPTIRQSDNHGTQATLPAVENPKIKKSESPNIDLEELEEEFIRLMDEKGNNAKAKKQNVTVQDLSDNNEKDTVPSKPQPQITIPNLLSPNGDGYNDCWVIKDIEKYKRTEIQLFTAKGNRVFSSANYRNDFCGNDLSDGNYFYILYIPELNYTRRGVLVIMR